MQPRVKAELWIKAHIRRCWSQDVIAVVARRGDEMAGTVLIKLNTLDDGCSVLQPAPSPEGGRIWLRATGPELVDESEADAYISRQVNFDPDLWVLEIEDRDGRHFLDEPVE
ncbi:MAG: DUF1491 family protein [Alphaproteobacteria bacterium]|jgi:hypothetical protein|nr:DUF1491 family protein [Alphaproteobacteria bacterium]